MDLEQINQAKTWPDRLGKQIYGTDWQAAYETGPVVRYSDGPTHDNPVEIDWLEINREFS